jgi:hypothetical protein
MKDLIGSFEVLKEDLTEIEKTNILIKLFNDVTEGLKNPKLTDYRWHLSEVCDGYTLRIRVEAEED